MDVLTSGPGTQGRNFDLDDATAACLNSEEEIQSHHSHTTAQDSSRPRFNQE